MPLNWTERPIGNIPFSASDTKSLIIPRDKPIRRMTLRFDINLTTTAVAPTYREDDILNVIKKIRLEMNGDTKKFNVKARMWFFVEKYEKGTAPQTTAPTTAVSTTASAFVTLNADFATDRTDEHDLSALLMARRLSSLELFIDWASATELASANAPTINASTKCIVEIREVAGSFTDRNGSTVDVFAINPAEIFEQMETVIVDANHTSFDGDTLAKDLAPAPSNVLKQALMVLDQTAVVGNKSNSIVTEFKVQRESPDIVRHIQRTWLSIWDMNKVEYQQETNNVGFLLLDWIDKLGGGLLNNTNLGDVKYRFLIATFAAGQTIDIYTRYVSVPRVQV